MAGVRGTACALHAHCMRTRTAHCTCNACAARALHGFRTASARLLHARRSYAAWVDLVEDLGLVDGQFKGQYKGQFTRREATLCFAWSRMLVIDEELPSGLRYIHIHTQ